jgi:hypothetical protein
MTSEDVTPELPKVKDKDLTPKRYNGVHADFSAEGKLIGIEVIDASEIMGKKIEFALPEVPRPEMKVASK